MALSATGARNQKGWVQRWTFPIVSFLLLALTIAGFSDNLFTDIHQPSNYDPKFIIHGLFCLAWMILLFVQTTLVQNRNIRLHRTLGTLGAFVALGVVASTLWVFVVVWTSWEQMSPEVRANRLLLPGFAVCLVLAFLNRKRSDWHRRLMLLGSVFMMGPVISRAFDPVFVTFFVGHLSEPEIEATFIPWFVGVWLALLASLPVYDVITIRRLHPVTMAGVAFFFAVWGVVHL